MLYITIILSGMLLIASINSHYSNLSGLSITYCILATALLTLFVIILDGIQAFIIRRLPSKWFDDSHKCYDALKKERRIYDFLGIKFWKDYVMELGGFTDFHKIKLLIQMIQNI